MRLISNPRQHLVAIGIAVTTLGLSAWSAPVLAQSSTAQDSSATAGNQRMNTGADDVATRVKAALKANPTLDSRHIDVSTDKGDVVLSGFMQSANGVTEAARVATQAAGSHKVINKLTIKQNYSNGAQ